MIKFIDVSFSYHAPTKLDDATLKNVSLEISPGEFVAIIGNNGSGKSTLARHMNGLLVPQNGDVFVFGENTKDEMASLSIKRNVGMVFQNPENQMVSSIVQEDVAFALENLGVPFDEMHERVEIALEQVGMWEHRTRAVTDLSGGQKQKVALAGVIVMKPRFIVLDEPTSMLDPQGRKDVLSIIKTLNKNYGIGIILITQLMDEAALTSRIIVMNKGSIIKNDVPDAIFSEPEFLSQVGLKPAMITQFCHELGRLGQTIPRGLIWPQECADEIFKLLQSHRCGGELC